MRYLFLLIVFPFSLWASSQKWKITGLAGYAVAETKSLKKIMFTTGTTAGVEFKLKRRYIISAELGYSLLRFEQATPQNLSSFNSKYFLTLSPSTKGYYAVSRKSFLSWNIGVYGRYLVKDKQEIRGGPVFIENKRHNLGFNFGFAPALGIRTMISPVSAFEVAIISQKDYFCSYKNDDDKIKTAQHLLALTFHRRF